MASNLEMTCLPDLCSRYASAAFTAIVAAETFTLGSVVYTFVATLGSPVDNNVEVRIQGTLTDTVKILARAIQGDLTAPTEIAYGTGTAPNPDCTAYWTSQKFSVGSTIVPAGENLHIKEKAENSNTSIPISTTSAGGSVNSFIRIASSRYILDGNHATDPQQSVRGSFQTIFPLSSVSLATTGITSPYDVEYVVIMDLTMSQSEAIEIDFYQSADEITFTRVARGISTMAKSQKLLEIPVNSALVAAGNGLYLRAGTNGINPTRYLEIKVAYAIN